MVKLLRVSAPAIFVVLALAVGASDAVSPRQPTDEGRSGAVLLPLDVEIDDGITVRNRNVDSNFVGTAVIASSGFALARDGGRWIQLRHCSAGRCPGDPKFSVKIGAASDGGYQITYGFSNGSTSSSATREKSGAEVAEAMWSMRQYTTADDALGVLIYRDLLT